MSPLLAAAVIVISAVVMIALMLVVRRKAPNGGRFTDSDRASGVFGFLGAGFVILLGFVIFLSFGTYDNARTQAESEAVAVVDQFDAAEALPPALRDVAQAQLVCYGRSVVNQEWTTMVDGQASPVTDSWIVSLEHTENMFPEGTAALSTAAKDWAEAANQRALGRRARLMTSQGEIPVLLWALLAIGAVLVVAYVLLYADPEEGVLPQVFMAGGVTVLVVASLLAVEVLSSPFQNQNGSIQPTGMEYSLGVIKAELAKDGRTLPNPCNTQGLPIAARR